MKAPPTVRFVFRRRPMEAPAGRSLGRTLATLRLPILQRSIRYHRPRAPYCGIGACTSCLVRVNGAPNVRACRYVPADGDRIETENAWPSPSFDVLGALDLLFYRGLDTLHGLRRPAWATPIYHRIVRRLAGYGRRPSDSIAPRPAEGARRSVDTIVVGGGSAGTAAHDRLVELGVDHLVVDRDLALPGTDASGSLLAASAVFLPPPRPGAELPFTLIAVDPQPRSWRIEARRVIVSTGSYDAGLWFAGSDRPGVLTADGAFGLSRPPESIPFERALVVGGGHRAEAVLRRFGERVEAVIAPGSITAATTQRAAEFGIPLYPRTLVLASRGRRRVRGLDLRPRGGGPAFALEGDAVVLAHRRLPNVPLLFQAGARMIWDGSLGAYVPGVGSGGATGVPGLFAAGSASGDPTPSEESGRLAAEAAAGRLAPGAPPPEPRARASGELRGYYHELRAELGRRGKWIACPCEDVLVGELVEASERGYRGIEVIKRYTGLGTGLCQGRYCVPEALLWLSDLEGRPPEQVGYITQRPPVFPTALGALARLPESGTGEPA